MSPDERVLRFITGNPGKVAELAPALAPHGWRVEQHDAGYPEIQADSLQEVARAGAEHLLAQGVEPPFVLEDAGLFIAALRGFPGVYSRHALDTLGVGGILQLMLPVEEELRTAAFEACLTYVDEAGRITAFTGRCSGRIANRQAGSQGFGFDPIFIPDGHDQTFAEMGTAAKGEISHRGRAVAAFVAALETAKR